MERIAFYITSLEGGGAERNTALIASEMARRGHPVLVIADRKTGPNLDLLDSRIEVCGLSGGNAAHIGQLRRRLRDWRADIVFARLGLCPIVAALAQITGGRWRTVISYHNPYDPKTHFGVRLSWWTASLLSRLTYRTLGMSQDVIDQLVLSYRAQRRKCLMISNPIDLEKMDVQRTTPLPDDFPKARPYLLSVGRLVEQKGYPDLIAAYSLVADKIEEDLVILGEGPLEAELRAQIAAAGLSERIHLVGYDPNPFPIYAGARLFVLASHWEGFGNVILEALACGTPVVVTNCPGGPKDILDHGRYGTLVPIKQPEALAEAIESALVIPPDSAHLRARAEEFRLTRVTDLYLDLVADRRSATT